MNASIRSKWAAVGAAIAVTLGVGGVSLSQASLSGGDKPVFVALVVPCRLVDTRADSNVGPKDTVLAAGEANAYEIQVTDGSGNCTGRLAVPANAVAVATNVTVIQPNAPTTGRSYFTVYRSDAPRPLASNLNFVTGQPPTANKVDVGLSTGGQITIYNNEGTAHVAVDVLGYYVDHNHDDRYYTEAEVDTATYYHIESLDGAGVETGVTVTTPGELRLVGTLGTLSKRFDDTDVKLTWMTQVRADGMWCSLQLHVRGEARDGGQINFGNVDAVPVTMVASFPSNRRTGGAGGLWAGSHPVEVYMENSVECEYNVGDFQNTVVVEEFAVFPPRTRHPLDPSP